MTSPAHNRGEGHRGEQERVVLQDAVRRGGTTTLSMGSLSAAIRLTDKGLGEWFQGSPFVASFRIFDAGREALAGANRGEGRT